MNHLAIMPAKGIRIQLPSKGGVLQETYHDWQLFFYYLTKGKKGKNAKGETAEKTGKVIAAVIRNPYGEFFASSRKPKQIQEEFEKVKAEIDKQLKGK